MNNNKKCYVDVRCAKCGSEKTKISTQGGYPVWYFLDRKNSEARICYKCYMINRYRTNEVVKEKAIESAMKWQKNNPEKKRISNNRWHQTHREEYNEYMRNYDRQHRSKKKLEAQQKREKWLAVNRANAKRYARENPGKISRKNKLYYWTNHEQQLQRMKAYRDRTRKLKVRAH